MWCPSVSLSVWANAWLAGQASPDDVLDALTAWAPVQSVAAYDAVAAGSIGLSWPGAGHAGPVALLQTLRAAPGPIHPVLPVPGDVRGLPPGTEFSREALSVGEAVILAGPGTAVGLIPEFIDDDPQPTMTWTVHALPALPVIEQHDLGAAEYALRSAVRSAAETMGAVTSLYSGPGDPRDLVEDLLDATRHHRIPDRAPARAVRVLENAALVDAIVTVGAEAVATGAQSSSQAQRVGEVLAPLAAVVRTARAAAVDAILAAARRA
ncbi:hypothetical protein KIH27_01600 [Mycobacterium sp. M1]|uniref:Uncharacterized protein n=1 Tax=Mycolicibacter acidiphilus TaxID=2835306 RepID=A0ABS5RDC1_9MYCO|nr:hypothetical protein [Mycolicibacter acidiphilus]MBS9532280.1 hypothetical protein [Mycolicibacter acidiphilus]